MPVTSGHLYTGCRNVYGTEAEFLSLLAKNTKLSSLSRHPFLRDTGIIYESMKIALFKHEPTEPSGYLEEVFSDHQFFYKKSAAYAAGA
jgi:hypothetical protein